MQEIQRDRATSRPHRSLSVEAKGFSEGTLNPKTRVEPLKRYVVEKTERAAVTLGRRSAKRKNDNSQASFVGTFNERFYSMNPYFAL